MLDVIKTGTVEGTGASINIELGFVPSWAILMNIDGDAKLDWEENMGAGKGYKTLGTAKTSSGLASADAVAVTDADTAASLGTALKFVTTDGQRAYLTSENAGNANAVGLVAEDGATFFVLDGTAGAAVYFDEDGTNADERFLVVSPSGKDLFVPLSDGTYLRLKHSATAASLGVAVYFDDNASNAYEKLLFVSPTDTDGVGAVDDEKFDSDATTITVPQVAELIASGGITPTDEDDTFHGFKIGADTDVNVAAETIVYIAGR